MSQNSNNNNNSKRMSLEEFDAIGGASAAPSSSLDNYSTTNSQSTPTSASTSHHQHAPHPMTIPAKKKPGWYRKAQEEKESQTDVQACLEDYFGHDAFRLGQGESIEAVIEGHDVAIMWDTERNRMVGYPRPTIETTFRRRVVHDALYQDYTEEYDYSSDDDTY